MRTRCVSLKPGSLSEPHTHTYTLLEHIFHTHCSHHIRRSDMWHHTSWLWQTLQLLSTQWMHCIIVHSNLEKSVCPLISESKQSIRKEDPLLPICCPGETKPHTAWLDWRCQFDPLLASIHVLLLEANAENILPIHHGECQLGTNVLCVFVKCLVASYFSQTWWEALVKVEMDYLDIALLTPQKWHL